MRETRKTKGIRTAYQHCGVAETGMATHSSNLAYGKSHGKKSLQATVHGVTKSLT